MARTLLVAVELLSASVWVGGLVAIGIVTPIARRELEPLARISFFRALGRRYLAAGGSSLAIALACGGELLANGSWSNDKSAAVAIAAALVLASAAGVAQARSLTVLRRAALDEAARPELAESVRRRARSAAALRSAIATLTLTLVVLAAAIVNY